MWFIVLYLIACADRVYIYIYIFHGVQLFLFLVYWEAALILSFDRKDERGLRFWLEKPAIDWMQHIDTKERIIWWVAFDFPDLPYPDFGLFHIPRNGRTGFRCSGPPSFRAGRPGAPSRLSDRSLGPQLCAARRSLPAGEILPVTHTNGSPLRLVKHGLLPFQWKTFASSYVHLSAVVSCKQPDYDFAANTMDQSSCCSGVAVDILLIKWDFINQVKWH